MRASEVVVVGPGLQVVASRCVGVGPVAGVSPFAQGGLDEAFGLAVGAWRVRAGATMVEAAVGRQAWRNWWER